ncbi:MAG: methyltransferase domain-containing protein, partial [Muribaculaceae bacterium]|nr:methyltransferase domain-containing protein [Muribaculaceae bacterium]
SFYPGCRLHLVDRIGKKINVAREIAAAVGLDNVTFQHGDIGECRTRYNYVVSRAVMALDALVPLISKNVERGRRGANRYTDGLVCLKGGDLSAEIAATARPAMEYDLREFIPEECFDTKKLIYVPYA